MTPQQEETMTEETKENCTKGIVTLTSPLMNKLLSWARNGSYSDNQIYLVVERINHYCNDKEYLSIEDLDKLMPPSQYISDELPIVPFKKSTAYR